MLSGQSELASRQRPKDGRAVPSAQKFLRRPASGYGYCRWTNHWQMPTRQKKQGESKSSRKNEQRKPKEKTTRRSKNPCESPHTFSLPTSAPTKQTGHD